jgi:hypothetical protein
MKADIAVTSFGPNSVWPYIVPTPLVIMPFRVGRSYFNPTRF